VLYHPSKTKECEIYFEIKSWKKKEKEKRKEGWKPTRSMRSRMEGLHLESWRLRISPLVRNPWRPSNFSFRWGGRGELAFSTPMIIIIIILVLYNSLCRYYLGSSSVVCSSKKPNNRYESPWENSLVSTAIAKNPSCSCCLSPSLSLSLCVCVSLAEAEMAISGASVSKRPKEGTKRGDQIQDQLWGWVVVKLGKQERKKERGNLQRKSLTAKGSLFLFLSFSLFCVGLESKEHNTFWESKRNSKAKQSKAKQRKKEKQGGSSSSSSSSWVLVKSFGSSPLFLFWVAKFLHRGQSKAKQKWSVILWYRVFFLN